MKKNQVGGILILSILISFICGAIGGYLILGSNNLSEDEPVINLNHSSVTLTEEDSIAKGVEAVYDAVVVVEGFQNNQLASTGTGFIYKKSGKDAYIMTNHHVIDGVQNVKVILSDNTVLDVEVMGSEAYSDIGILKVDASKIKSVAVIGDTNKLNVGDTLFTVGSPEGADYAGTVTKGILSGKDRLVSVAVSNSSQYDYYMKVIQTDAAINPGNSGGPICNINGEVIGVTNMKLVDSTVEGMGFAIPIEDALIYAATLEKGEEVVRPYIGIGMLDINDMQNLFFNQILVDESITSGVVITEVADNSPASKAKLKKGDVITELAGEKITSIAQFRYELYKHSPDETIEIKYIRNGKEKTVKVKLTANNQ
ncbi:MAG: serine protease [Bacilli bacterium]|nr:serine protease [Bacilli bacterium]